MTRKKRRYLACTALGYIKSGVAQRILLIEDNAGFRKAVGETLRLAGYSISAAPTGRQGLAQAARAKPDLIVLDLVMPGLSGQEVCQKLKEDPRTASVPVLILTGNDRDGQDIACLDLGADDYLTKPVKAERLVAYCKALLRRAPRGKKPSKTLALGPLELDYARKTVRLGKDEHPHLTPKEFELLYHLARKSPDPQDRAALYKEVWGLEAPSEGSLKTVEVHVRRIRLKLGWKSSEWLTTISGRGYRLLPP